MRSDIRQGSLWIEPRKDCFCVTPTGEVEMVLHQFLYRHFGAENGEDYKGRWKWWRITNRNDVARVIRHFGESQDTIPNTYLIKWNSKRSGWKTLASDVEQMRRKGFIDHGWSCGNTRRIQSGDRVFLLRTGIAPRGIMASGVVTKEPYKAAHWDSSRRGKTALYIGVRFDALVHPDQDGILAIEGLQSRHLAKFPWGLQTGGMTIPSDAAVELEAAWSAFLSAPGQQPASLADEVTTPGRFIEGATRQISVNAYERNPHARHQCIEHYGCRCSVCGFDFEVVYGKLGRGFIHVHHLKPLAQIRAQYEVDPIADLRPICPNCHAMIHRKTEMMSIAKLRQRIQE